jgi:UDP-N-acetylmuramate: L-alanyl-gamma-D-glutamyl-meso-diaminopimelate ligase
MRIHFIAIGGSAMHNLAIALKLKGYQISGSDDEIFEPSLSRLRSHGILPDAIGWHPDLITSNLDAVVLGMHARADNPELAKAKELGLKIYSYPEYLYEQTKGKTRVVIGGSHGKTTITSMVMHVLRSVGVEFDYMVGAQLEGFENMVSLSETARIAVFEGDEYLTSPIDLRPKFHLYKPHIALISGIAWDHINAFPTFEIYRKQFEIFVESIEPKGSLIFCSTDPEVARVAKLARPDVTMVPYAAHTYKQQGQEYLLLNGGDHVPLKIIGEHNMQNIAGAKGICNQLGISDADFYEAIKTFSGAAKRLQVLAYNTKTKVFLDFAHSPSKVKATVNAVREAYANKKLVACLELHTFSSLNAQFIEQYKNTLQGVDVPIVFFDPHTIAHKKLANLSPQFVQSAFGDPAPLVISNSNDLVKALEAEDWADSVLLIMTSGNFSGVNLQQLALRITESN